MRRDKHTDLFEKFDGDQGYFGKLRQLDDTYFCAPELPEQTDHRFNYHGKDVISWSLNNYLGLANHPQIHSVATAALDESGISAPMGSRMLTGTTSSHLALEKKLATYTGKEASFLFNYGYLGVLGTICSIVGSNDTIVIDKLAHSCMVDGAVLSQATIRIFKHNNMDDLERVLRSVHKRGSGGILVAVEGVYGMTGDISRLQDITILCKQYGARLFVDDAHGWGVMGENGKGCGEHLGVQKDIDLYFGTFAKAFAAIGGMTACSKKARDWIAFNARTQVFAKSLPMIYVKALDKTLDLIEKGNEYRATLWRISHRLKNKFRELGFEVGQGESPICSLYLPLHGEDCERAGMKYVRWLRERGVFVSAVVYPVIPRDMLMFRIVPTAHHTDEDIDKTIAVFAELREQHSLTVSMSAEEKLRLDRIYNP